MSGETPVHQNIAGLFPGLILWDGEKGETRPCEWQRENDDSFPAKRSGARL